MLSLHILYMLIYSRFGCKIRLFWWNKFSNLIKGALSGLRQFSAAESPFKMLKNAFYSRQKLFSFSRYLSFCLGFLVMLAKRLGMKDKINYKIYDVIAWKTNSRDTNISRSKDKETMKFGQSIECTLRNIFLEKSYTKRGG